MTRPLQDIKLEPWWWEAAPRPASTRATMPAKVDVVIVGSGYTGLSAALVLARAGRSVLICERETAGWGASSRNQGHIGASFKRGLAKLTRALGASNAERLFREGFAAVEHCKQLVADEAIDCHIEHRGRFVAACSQAHYDALAAETELRKRRAGLDADMVSKADVSKHIGSERFHGGALLHREAALHGALFHRGLLARVREAGVVVSDNTQVTGIVGNRAGFEVRTAGGVVSARDVIVATNGYTGSLTPWLQRRVVPVNSFGIATEPLEPARLNRVLPGRRPCIDTLNLAHGFRIAPDDNRLIFGTRPPTGRGNLATAAGHLRNEMLSVFPDLHDVRITHGWTGFTGFPFELLPHVGKHNGIHYALGYCGYGVSLAPYLGRKLALRVLGDPQGETVFAKLAFPTRPFYAGNPWFLSIALLKYRWQDNRCR